MSVNIFSAFYVNFLKHYLEEEDAALLSPSIHSQFLLTMFYLITRLG